MEKCPQEINIPVELVKTHAILGKRELISQHFGWDHLQSHRTLMAVFFYISLIFLILVISISWTHPRGGPWIPTSLKTLSKMLDLADVKPDELVYDLGCGDGRLIVAAARKYQARAVGIELDPLRYLWCQLLISVLGLRGRVKVLYGDLFKADLSGADVVACYLLPEANKRLEHKLLRELRPGTRVVTNTFIFYQVRMAKQDGKARLYLFSPENTLVEYIKDQLKSTAEKKEEG